MYLHCTDKSTVFIDTFWVFKQALNHFSPLARIGAGSTLARIHKYILPDFFSHGEHLSMWLCHEEKQKHKITREEQQNRKGTAQRRKTGLLRWQILRITQGKPSGN
jgi:hypothetical protein